MTGPEVVWLEGRPVAMVQSLPMGTIVESCVDRGPARYAGGSPINYPIIVVEFPDGTRPVR